MWNEITQDYKDRFGIAIIYGFFVLLSLLSAIVLFGILQSTGFVELYFPNYVKEAKFGGAASIFVITLIFLIKQFSQTLHKTIDFTIKGNIYNFQGDVLENVNIFIEGDNRSTKSDSNGYFTIDVVSHLTEWQLIAKYENATVRESISKEKIRKPISIKFPKPVKKKVIPNNDPQLPLIPHLIEESSMSRDNHHSRTTSPALKEAREKLNFLLREQILNSDPLKAFELKKRIEELQQQIKLLSK